MVKPKEVIVEWYTQVNKTSAGPFSDNNWRFKMIFELYNDGVILVRPSLLYV